MQREYLLGMGALNGDPSNGQMPFPFHWLEGTADHLDKVRDSGINIYDPKSLIGRGPNQR